MKKIYDWRFHMNKISELWMRSGTWNRRPIKKFAWLIHSLATFVGTRNLNRPAGRPTCKF